MNIETFTFNFQHNAIALRLNAGLTQHRLADALQVNQRSIGAIEEGRALGIEKLYAYSVFFDIKINDLISRKLAKSELTKPKILVDC